MLQTWSSDILSALLIAGAAVMLAAASHDFATRTVPNWMALTLAAIGLCARTLDGHFISGMLVGIAVFVAAAFCWRRGWMGGGDAKLLSAASLVVPPHLVIPFIVAMSLAGGVLALIYLAAQRLLPQPRYIASRNLLARVVRAECWRVHRGCPLPYACAIGAGFLFVLF